LFFAWLVLEILICAGRFAVLVVADRAARAHRKTPTDLHLLFALAWSMSVGFGAEASLASGDWQLAILACVSAAAMVGGICFRNFSAPRLAGAMILLSLGPLAGGVILAGHPVLYLGALQVPLYFWAMTAGAFRLNQMQIATLRSERENVHRARHDALTGLLNRGAMVEALRSRLAAGDRPGQSCALFFLDLDNFKPVNDTFGHQAGDRLLELVAARLRHTLPPGDLIGRMGGDEFVVLAKDVTAEQAPVIGQRIIEALAAPYDLDNDVVARVGASVGIALAPEHADQPEMLLAIADAALYEAKSDGKSRSRLATAETNLAALRELRDRRGADRDGIPAAA
jgi:diguanylate cyclase (GGDEF)-like protein